MNYNRKNILAILVLLILVFFRLIPHPPNFTPILAISVFSGIKFKSNLFSYFVPVLAMFLSDAIIGFHSGIYLTYATLIIAAAVSRRFNNINLAALSSSFLFFLITNFYVWVISSTYSKTFIGIIECYTLAFPFFAMTLLSTFFFTYCLFYGFSYISSIQLYQKI